MELNPVGIACGIRKFLSNLPNEKSYKSFFLNSALKALIREAYSCWVFLLTLKFSLDSSSCTDGQVVFKENSIERVNT